MQKILSYMRKAIEDYDMIQDGDKIAVALSGGKDSTTLLLALKNLQIFYPKKFDLIAITVDPGFENFDTKYLEDLCNKIGVIYHIEKSNIKEIVFDIRQEKNPCSLCANLRRGILNTTSIKLGCNKIALGHTEDDVIQTFLLNLLYNGNLSTFSPVAYMDRSQMTLIRPLVYTPEKEIKRFIKKNQISVMPKVCPMDGKSKREFAKNLLKQFCIEIPYVHSNFIGAIKRSNLSGWKEDK